MSFKSSKKSFKWEEGSPKTEVWSWKTEAFCLPERSEGSQYCLDASLCSHDKKNIKVENVAHGLNHGLG